ncbi:bifunctional 2-C-methyl-D-erythritol 4-phosphate cytidylyltransferase/2-C-methyl-D-erythritol 2,4-cyclodiphosphate synthase [Tardibacter chloracetimidivorans]|uniref:Bifunctional enzyme IspD/IspF n=1 Tax=Tardibacter chloracetimidivorans TaxID=1921510 RepID=A0A1L3ZZF9_9SPHN|nr:bifunctional 2-C-methyl-D-erythritol 4-phosphate cytidylyltransferase/2-C-methyl-D-erythritol 2,4-cyclodiphosphate synthase [Tardibacter chloracetimidivorans]
MLVAAGRGARSGLNGPKQYHRIGGRAVLAHAVAGLEASSVVDTIIPVIHPDDIELYERATAGQSLAAAVHGGATRRESVLAGLEAIAASGGADVVLIHDAARPFIPGEVVARLLQALRASDGAIPVLPVVDTIIRDGVNIDRAGLTRVQTPQAFRFDSILAAHRAWTGSEPTDDAEVARAAGLRVAEVAGDEMLKKLTAPDDFGWAERTITAAMTTRTGMGFDVHAFGEGASVWLCGVEIPHSRGLVGHSDADVGLHALTDALLGAVGEGDIGTHFPPSEPRWKGAASHLFAEHARDLIGARGGVIDHVDVTLICEEPKVGPHRAAMRARVAGMLQVDPHRVSIKATTTERLGFTGRREGIAAQAIATIRLPDKLE